MGNAIKKTILTLLLAAMSTGAMAEWVKVSESIDDTVFYIDPATVRKDGTFRKVWTVHDRKQKDESGAMSRRSFMEFDCIGERHRILTFSTHSEPMVGGKMLISGDEPLNWRNTAPGTPAATVLKLVCSV